VAIIRPDKFVYALASGGGIGAAVQHLLRTMDRPHATEQPARQIQETRPLMYS
jgi:hypothetical protein